MLYQKINLQGLISTHCLDLYTWYKRDDIPLMSQLLGIHMPEIGNILNDIISTFKKIDALWFDTHLDFIGTFDKLTKKIK